jgi:dihydrofolate reductase
MKKLHSFLLLSIDGYFADEKGDTRWGHGRRDPEFDAFTTKNASHGGTLLMGRKTYETMLAYWPTPEAKKDIPEVAKGMDEAEKVVFSRTLAKSNWKNTRFVKGDLTKEVEKLKREAESDITILGSGSIVKQLADAGLIDAFQFVVSPVALGAGQTIFSGLAKKLDLELVKSKAFKNGIVVSDYVPTRKK